MMGPRFGAGDVEDVASGEADVEPKLDIDVVVDGTVEETTLLLVDEVGTCSGDVAEDLELEVVGANCKLGVGAGLALVEVLCGVVDGKGVVVGCGKYTSRMGDLPQATFEYS